MTAYTWDWYCHLVGDSLIEVAFCNFMKLISNILSFCIISKDLCKLSKWQVDEMI